MGEHKRLLGRLFGPGGMGCPCCNPFHKGRSQRYTKRTLNRRVRQALKRQDRELSAAKAD